MRIKYDRQQNKEEKRTMTHGQKVVIDLVLWLITVVMIVVTMAAPNKTEEEYEEEINHSDEWGDRKRLLCVITVILLGISTGFTLILL
jgi:cytosine/uracil/thiamine/allantoin permease